MTYGDPTACFIPQPCDCCGETFDIDALIDGRCFRCDEMVAADEDEGA